MVSPHPAELNPIPSTPELPLPLPLRIGFWICIAISVAVVLRRIAALLSPPRSAAPQLAGLDATFSAHSALTLAHILPALLFVILAPFIVFRPNAKSAWPQRIVDMARMLRHEKVSRFPKKIRRTRYTSRSCQWFGDGADR